MYVMLDIEEDIHIMEYTTLGRTGLRVSVAGLGCGGHSRVGQGTGKSETDSIAIIRQALDVGVNFIDTAVAYETETIVGKALEGYPPDNVILSTKAHVARGKTILSADEVIGSLEASLRRLRRESVDVFHLHCVPPWGCDAVLSEIVPPLLKEREKGKFRFLGITEMPPIDPYHETLQRAVQEDCFDVMMLAFHMLNQSARTKLFTATQDKGIGILNMFAVRLLFSRAGRLKETVDDLVATGKLPDWFYDKENPLDFLLHPDGAHSIIDAAYRYCRHEPGTDVILFGTGNPDHLRSNIESILRGPLPESDLHRIRELFGHLEGVGLDPPPNRQGPE